MSHSTTKPIRAPAASAPATTLHPPAVVQAKGKERLLTRLQSISSPRPTFLTAPPPTPSGLGSHHTSFPLVHKPNTRVRINRKAIKIRLITWNMCENLPTGSLSELLGYEDGGDTQEGSDEESESEDEDDLPQFKGKGHPYHLIVVAAQECPTASGVVNGKLPINFSGKGWSSLLESWLCAEPEGAEIKIDHQVPPSPGRSSTPIPPSPSRSTTPLPPAPSSLPLPRPDSPGSKAESAEEKPFHYILASKERLLPGIFLAVFVAVPCQHLLTDISTSRVATGLLSGRIGNKGGIGTSLVFGGQRLLFLCVHLAAHAGEKYNELRKAMLGRIFNELDLDDFSSGNTHQKTIEGSPKVGEGEKSLAERWDQVFVMGDMNFRLDITRSHADWLLKTKDYANALKFDQLNKYLKEEGSVLAGFAERTPEFPPTYKYDVKKPAAPPVNGFKRPSLSRNKSTTPNGLLRSDTTTREKNGLGLDGLPAAAPMMKMESLEEWRENAPLAITVPKPSGPTTNGPTLKVSASPSLTADEHDLSMSDRDSICSALSDDADDLLSPHPHSSSHPHPHLHPLPPLPNIITTLSESESSIDLNSSVPVSPKKKKKKNKIRFKKIFRKVRVMNMLRPPTHDSKVDDPTPTNEGTDGSKVKGEVEMLEEEITLAKLVEEEVFDSSAKKRVQSYTDRILFKSNVAYGRPDYVPPRPPTPPPPEPLPNTVSTTGTPTLGARNFSAAIVDFIKHPTQAVGKPGFRRNASSSSANGVMTLADSRARESEEGNRRRSASKGRVSFGPPARSQSLAVPSTSFSSPFHFSNPFSNKHSVVHDSPASIEVALPTPARKSMTAERGSDGLARSSSLVRFSSLGRSRSLANSVATSNASNRGYFWSRRRNKSLSTPGEQGDGEGRSSGDGKRGLEFTRSRTNPVVYDTPLGVSTTPTSISTPAPTTSFLKNLLHLPPIAYLSTLISTLPLSSPPLTTSPLHSPFGLDPTSIGEVIVPPKKRQRRGPRRGEIIMEHYDSVRGLGGSDHRAVVGVAFIGVEEEGIEESWVG